MSDSKTRYEVAIHGYGLKVAGGGVNNPCEGLAFPKHEWVRITPRPLGLKRAKEIADAQSCHVCVWKCAEVAHDNGKRPYLPEGWRLDAPYCACSSPACDLCHPTVVRRPAFEKVKEEALT